MDAAFTWRKPLRATASDNAVVLPEHPRNMPQPPARSADHVRSFPSIPWERLGWNGDLHTGETLRMLYATDASEYEELPAAVALPRSEEDLAALVRFAAEHRIPLVPRAAGTSLAGQVVGGGVVVDTGRHLNQILSINPAAMRARVQPGVVRDELNRALGPHGLFFAPETSTANRAMIGGMVGNNSCGANSIVYGSTRDRMVSMRGYLSDGSMVSFGPLNPEEIEAKCNAPDSLETRIYRHLRRVLSDPGNRRLISSKYPAPGVARRNTGYALDLLMDAAVFDPPSGRPFNLCRLLAGSEGTLLFGVEYELELDPLPPKPALLAAHFAEIREALEAVLIALEHHPSACELIDRHILECAKATPSQRGNRFFIEGDPGALLVVEMRRESMDASRAALDKIAAAMRQAGLGFAFPVLEGANAARVWELRKAGQAVMNNVTGPERPAECVEDTAVDVRDLPAYLAEFDALMREKHGISCVYYGHAGAGEIHTRPLMNLYTGQGRKRFRAVAEDVALLVKKFRGSLSGEHGDGRLRGEFLESFFGPECFALQRQIKELFDPDGIFNPGKIFGAPPMDSSLRGFPPEPDIPGTFFDFSNDRGIGGASTRCNGCGECRKPARAGGTMCPSYMASGDEADTPRARANLLRHILSAPSPARASLAHPALVEILDRCLACKGCLGECPTNVDISKFKAEVLQSWHEESGVPLRSWIVAHFAAIARASVPFAGMLRSLSRISPLRRAVNELLGFHPDRLPPLPATRTFRAWFRAREASPRLPPGARRVILFCDEFTDLFEPENGIAAVEVLEALGFRAGLAAHCESGRAALSKGLLDRARTLARNNVRMLAPLVSGDVPLVGIEPSALLCFRDEYPALLRGGERDDAIALSRNCHLIDEFLADLADAGRIPDGIFNKGGRIIHLHAHCQQRALGSVASTVRMLSLPPGNEVRVIPSGCCGMAGSFGMEAEHYGLSMQIAEQVLLPYIRPLSSGDLIAAPGTSCRHQIFEGAGRGALHPVRILREALWG